MGIIITGHQRSGTSILRRVCNSHPEIELTNEFGWYMFLNKSLKEHMQLILKQLVKKRNNPILPPADKKDRRVKGLDFGHNSLLVLHYLASLLQYRQNPVTANSVDRALKNLFPGSSYVGDKHPDYLFKLDNLTRFSELRCVVIYRDPRDMASSVLMKSRGEWKDYWAPELQHAYAIAQRWVHLIEKMEQNQEETHMIRYEEFVQDPESVSSGLASYLDIDPKGFFLEDINPKSIGKYRNGLTSKELAAITEHAGEAMLRMGYEI